ncbi:RNA-directed DNA polymerase [Listeria cornellensis]|uniref:RNA-directed DNA polymerase n=1 Tax=Listeria cornellensis TaxID=1494961 RepID=UPI00056AFE1E|nr:RNA-directed DNA polymerase [Listeria cornellensis]
MRRRIKEIKALLGNKLDNSVQLLNSLQTNGILTGNAISRIVSEIILCAVDKEIIARIPDIKYLRFVDDYFIFVQDRSQVDGIISCFQQELARYELIINENKVNVLESPFVFGNAWVEQMKVFVSLNPMILLEKTVIEYHEYKDIAILKYGLKIIRTMKFTKKEWRNIEPIIINILVKFPNLASIITLIIKNNENHIDRILLKNSIYTIIDIHLKLNNDEEIIWAVWLAKTFNISLSLGYIKKLLVSENWLAIIIILDMVSKRKKEKGVRDLIVKFRNRIKEEYFSDGDSEKNMYSEIWLIAYESDKNKWLNTGGNELDQFVEARKNGFFKQLKNKSVDFYKSDYEYDLIQSANYKNNIYVTYRELIEILGNFKESILENKLDILDESEYEKYLEEVYELAREHISSLDNY